jgi:hypothetical protein
VLFSLIFRFCKINTRESTDCDDSRCNLECVVGESKLLMCFNQRGLVVFKFVLVSDVDCIDVVNLG